MLLLLLFAGHYVSPSPLIKLSPYLARPSGAADQLLWVLKNKQTSKPVLLSLCSVCGGEAFQTGWRWGRITMSNLWSHLLDDKRPPLSCGCVPQWQRCGDEA